MKKLSYSGTEFNEIRNRVDHAETLAAIGQQTNNMFLEALLAAIEQPNKKLLRDVCFIVRNRRDGGSLTLEDNHANEFIESFRK